MCIQLLFDGVSLTLDGNFSLSSLNGDRVVSWTQPENWNHKIVKGNGRG